MTVFLVIAIIALTVSNVLLWLVFKGMQMMMKSLCDDFIEIENIITEEEEP